MIPVTSKEFIKVEDPDNKGIFIHLRYLLDKNQVEFFKLFKQFRAIFPEPKEGEAADREAQVKGVMLEKMDVALPVIDGLINLFVCGWSGETENKKQPVPLSKNTPPSSLLPVAAKMQLISFIFDSLEELMAVKEEELGK